MKAETLRKRRRDAALYREERGLTLAEAGAAFGMCAATVMRGARELAAERAGVELPKRAWSTRLADMHGRGLSPLTIYNAGCRCKECRAAKRAERERRVEKARRKKEAAEAAERLERMTAKANEPIRDLHIHGLGTLTVMPDGGRIIKVVE